MCWYCCISLRGAVYFGTSIHIFVGLVLFVRWLVQTYFSIFVTQKFFVDTSLLLITILSGLYVISFIFLGCLVFAATERQSVSLLKWSSSGFTILQFLVFTVILVLYLFAPQGWTFIEPGIWTENTILTISMYFCCLVATLNYILVLLLYLRKLWNNRDKQNSGRATSSSLTNIRISHPIQHHSVGVPSTTNSNASTYGAGPGHHQQYQYQNNVHGRRGVGPESPEIYESLDTQSTHPFFPANFYSGPHRQEGLYSGTASIRSGSGSGIYYHQRPNNYPYPHQRYREPLIERSEEVETPGQDWREAYGHRLQVFQRGQAERNSNNTGEPLLMQEQIRQTNY